MKPIVFALLAGLCWGVGEVLTKQVLASKAIGPLTVVCVRILACVPLAILLYLVVHAALKSEPAQWYKADAALLAKLLIGPALLAGFGGVLFFYLGIASGSISVVKPIAFTLAPALAAIIGWLVLREAMSVQKAAGIACTLLGVVLIATSGHHSPTAPAHTPEPPRAAAP